MNKLCRECDLCLRTVVDTEELLFHAEDGPWCGEALARIPRDLDSASSQPLPFTKIQLNSADVKVQRAVPFVFDILSGVCGSRGRWFLPVEKK
jgi:hypothetical protein